MLFLLRTIISPTFFLPRHFYRSLSPFLFLGPAPSPSPASFENLRPEVLPLRRMRPVRGAQWTRLKTNRRRRWRRPPPDVGTRTRPRHVMVASAPLTRDRGAGASSDLTTSGKKRTSGRRHAGAYGRVASCCEVQCAASSAAAQVQGLRGHPLRRPLVAAAKLDADFVSD